MEGWQMSVEEFRNSCPGDRNEDFYRGSFNCAKGNLYHAIESLGFAIEYFVDTEDSDYKEFDDCLIRLTASLDKIENRIGRKHDKKMSDHLEFINGIYDKEKNSHGNLRESQSFSLKGKYYWADLNTLSVSDLQTECMIFESNENGEVTNWSEVYCRRNIDVTRENLLKCINEFKREMEENK
jgi:hypothetical protein